MSSSRPDDDLSAYGEKDCSRNETSKVIEHARLESSDNSDENDDEALNSTSEKNSSNDDDKEEGSNSDLDSDSDNTAEHIRQGNPKDDGGNSDEESDENFHPNRKRRKTQNDRNEPLPVCTICKKPQKDNDMFADESLSHCKLCIGALKGVTSLARPPVGREGYWKRDRAVVFELLKRGVQMYDCEPLRRLRETAGAFQLLPSSPQGLVGTYNVKYLGWETNGPAASFHKNHVNVLHNRTIHGCMRLFQEDDSRSDDFTTLRGEISLGDNTIFEEETASTDDDADTPFGKQIAFRFGGTRVDLSLCDDSIASHGEDEDCCVACVYGDGWDKLWDGRSNKILSWGGYSGSSFVRLQVLQEPVLLDWIPRDYCKAAQAYPRYLRQQFRQRASRKVDYGKHWLRRHLSCPETAVKRICDFLECRLPDPQLALERGDVLLSTIIEDSGRFLRINVVATKQEAGLP